jgi:N-acetylmuramoyl-L-alanine amidase
MTVKDAFLSLNPYSRPGCLRKEMKALIMHWTAVPNQPASQVRDFFESRKGGKLGYGSAHYIVDLDGFIIRCIPEGEVAYHVGSGQIDPASRKIYTDWARAKFGEAATDPNTIGPNICTLGIEMCPSDADGNFRDATLKSAVELAADICLRLALNPLEDIATHHLVVGWKCCPKLWTDHPEKLDEFRRAVKSL